MGRACKCCEGECQADKFYFQLDRYAPSIRSLFEKKEDFYEVVFRQDIGPEGIKPRKLIDLSTFETGYDESLFVANTYRTEKISDEVFLKNNKNHVRRIFKKTTIVRKLVLEFSVEDVFDWEKQNLNFQDYINEISLRLGTGNKGITSRNPLSMDGSNEWKSNNNYSKLSGSVKNKDLPVNFRQFDSLVDFDNFITEFTDDDEYQYIDIYSKIHKENAKFIFLFEPIDEELVDEYLDNAEESVIGSLVKLGDWTNDNLENKFKNIVWLELYRIIRSDLSFGVSNEPSGNYETLRNRWEENIQYDWHTCFERVAEGEYVSTCKYTDSFFNFEVFDFNYFKEGSKLEIEFFKPKTDNTKKGARVSEAKFIYELVNVGNIIQEYEYHPVYFRMNPDPENLPCNLELVGEAPDYSGCDYTYKAKDKEKYEWNLRYSATDSQDRTQQIIMAKYSNPCDSFATIRFPGRVSSCTNSFFRLRCEFTEIEELATDVGLVFVRDCVIETTRGFYKEGDYTHRYEARYPIHGEFDPLNIKIKFTDHQYYPEVIHVEEIYNTRTKNNPNCPTIECLGGPAILEWSLHDESFVSEGVTIDLTEHHLSIYGIEEVDGVKCRTKIIAVKEEIYPIDFVKITDKELSTVYAVLIPSSEFFYEVGYHLFDQFQSTYRASVQSPYYTDSLIEDFDVLSWRDGVANNQTTSFFILDPYFQMDQTIFYGGGEAGGMGRPGNLNSSSVCVNAVYRDYKNFSTTRSDFTFGDVSVAVGGGYVEQELGPQEFYSYEGYVAGVPPTVLKGAINDKILAQSTYAVEDKPPSPVGITNHRGSTAHEIVVVDEPFVFYQDFSFWTAPYYGDIVEMVLGYDRKDKIDGNNYITGEGIRFRAQEAFLKTGSGKTSFSTVDPLYQYYVPIIVQDKQLDEDQVAEIAGYLTDFDYWYKIEGTFFIEDPEGEDLSDDGEGNIIIGRYVTDKWFFIDGSGNINGPLNNSGFTETLPDFAVYDKVEVVWEGVDTNSVYFVDDLESEYNRYPIYYLKAGESGGAISLYSFSEIYTEGCVTTEYYEITDRIYDDYFIPESVIMDCWTPRIDVYMPKHHKNFYSEFNCDFPVTIDPQLIMTGHGAEPPEVTGSFRTVSGTIDSLTEPGSPFKHRVTVFSGNWYDYDFYKDSGLDDVLCLYSNPCAIILGTQARRCSSKQTVYLEPGEIFEYEFSVPSFGINIPKSFDYTYNQGEIVSSHITARTQQNGITMPVSKITQVYKKTVPRFNCNNLPTINFTGDDLLFADSIDGFQPEIDDFFGIPFARGVLTNVLNVFSPYSDWHLGIYGSSEGETFIFSAYVPPVSVVTNIDSYQSKRLGFSWDTGREYDSSGMFLENTFFDKLERILSSVQWNILEYAPCSSDRKRRLSGNISRSTIPGGYGSIREREEVEIQASFQGDTYGYDFTYWRAYDAYNSLLDEYNLTGSPRSIPVFQYLLATYQSGVDICSFDRVIMSGQEFLHPQDWSTNYSCPAYRPSIILPDSLLDENCSEYQSSGNP